MYCSSKKFVPDGLLKILQPRPSHPVAELGGEEEGADSMEGVSGSELGMAELLQ